MTRFSLSRLPLSKFLLIALCLLPCVFAGRAGAQAWALTYDSNTGSDFAATRAAGAAGSTLVNGWTDISGSVWSTGSGVLQSTSIIGNLRRPLAEAQTAQRIVVNLPAPLSGSAYIMLTPAANASGAGPCVVLGGNNNSPQFYASGTTNNGDKNGPYSAVVSPGSFVSSHSYMLDVNITAAGQLTGYWYDTTVYPSDAATDTPNTAHALSVITYANGATVSGPPALSTSFYPTQSAISFSRIRTYRSAATAFSTSPATVTASTTGNAVTLTGVGTAWVSGTTFAVSSTGTGAAITAQTVNSSTSASLTLTAGTAGTLTLSDSGTGSDSATTTITVSPPPLSIATDNANLFWSPKCWVVTNGSSITNCAGAYLKGAVSYSTQTVGASLTVNFDVSPETTAAASAGQYPVIRYTVDGAPWTSYTLTSATTALVLASNLGQGTHTYEVNVVSFNSSLDRWTAPAAVVKIASLTLYGSGATSAPALLPKRGIIFGDSITEASNLGNAQVGYAGLLLTGLNCEYGQIGYSAQGLTSATGSSYGNVPALTSSYALYYAGAARSLSGLDYCAFNMGTNDARLANILPTPFANALYTSGADTGFLKTLRTAVGASCKIIGIVPFGQYESSGWASGWAAYKAAYPSDNAVLLNLGTSISGGLLGSATSYESADGLHPSQEYYAKLAALLLQQYYAGLSGASAVFGSGQIKRGR